MKLVEACSYNLNDEQGNMIYVYTFSRFISIDIVLKVLALSWLVEDSIASRLVGASVTITIRRDHVYSK